jgi:hypothetical protein
MEPANPPQHVEVFQSKVAMDAWLRKNAGRIRVLNISTTRQPDIVGGWGNLQNFTVLYEGEAEKVEGNPAIAWAVIIAFVLFALWVWSRLN